MVVPKIEQIGSSVFGEYEKELQMRCARLFNPQRPNPEKFGGAQPISFLKRHLRELEREDYFVSEKADGIRVLLFQSSMGRLVETFLIDRKNRFYQVPFKLPHPKEGWQNNSVLDGELVIDVDKDGVEKLRFYAFDCCFVNGFDMTKRDYGKRLGYLRNEVVAPYEKRVLKDPEYAKSRPFSLVVKPLELAYGVARVFENIPLLQHGNDGLIFTSVNAPYVSGRCKKILKWKPIDENTVDFKVRADKDESGKYHFVLQIWEGGDIHTDEVELVPEKENEQDWQDSPPHRKVLECRYDPTWPNFWRFHRLRPDKANGNHRSTFDGVMESIFEHVTQKELTSHASKIREKWKARHAPQPARPTFITGEGVSMNFHARPPPHASQDQSVTSSSSKITEEDLSGVTETSGASGPALPDTNTLRTQVKNAIVITDLLNEFPSE